MLKLICATALFGTISLFVKNIALSSGEISLWRAVIAVFVIGAYKLIKREKLPFSKIKGDALPLVLSGIAIGFNWILLFEAYKYTSVSVATLSYYFAPSIVMALCPLLFKERSTLVQWLCFGAATLGLVFIIGARGGGQKTEIFGICLGLSAACLYAFVIIMNKRIKTVSGSDKTLFQFFAAIAVLAIYVPLTSGIHVFELDTKGLLCLLVLGALHTGAGYCMYFSAVSRLSGQKVALFSYVDPLVAVLVSVAFLHETVTWVQLFGGALIIGFSVINEVSSRRKAPAKIK
ncbi:MAG: DMT family transporter [Oscillospiraceae bacterium]